MSRWKAEGLLFLAPLIWGASFAVTKGSLDTIGPNWLLAFRFTLAALFLTVLVRKNIHMMNRRVLWAGVVLGVLLYLIQWFQTVGMLYTTAGRSAFLTATYVVMTPFVVWAVFRKRPTALQFLGGVLSLFGVGLIALNEGLGMGRGEILSLLSGAACAVSYVVTERAAEGCDVMLLTWIQMIVCTVLNTIAALCTEPFTLQLGMSGWLAVVFLGVAASGISVVCQNVGLKYIDSSHASLVFATEAVFGVAFGVLLLREQLEMRMLIGSAIVLAAIILSSRSPQPKTTEK